MEEEEEEERPGNESAMCVCDVYTIRDLFSRLVYRRKDIFERLVLLLSTAQCGYLCVYTWSLLGLVCSPFCQEIVLCFRCTHNQERERQTTALNTPDCDRHLVLAYTQARTEKRSDGAYAQANNMR